MPSSRRNFLASTVAATVAASARAAVPRGASTPMAATYARMDAILKQPVLRRELFPEPVILTSVELLRYKDNFLCRVRSKDGAEGFSIGNNEQLKSLFPIVTNRLAPFFVGKDARDLDTLIERVTVYNNNYKLQSPALWTPLATIEFAILDLLGKLSGKSIGQLIGDGHIYNTHIAVYQANGERHISAEETLDHLHKELDQSHAKAIKFKVGGRMSDLETPPGRSEKLIPMVRKAFGDQMVISADSNGSYTVAEALPIGRLMQDYGYAFYEEPVPFDWYEEVKQVSDALKIPIALGEQEPSTHNFRWLLSHKAIQIVQQDMFYFGGMVRSMRIARMAAAQNIQCIPHISATGLGYLYMMHFVAAIPNAGPYHEFKEFNRDLPFHCPTSTLLSADGTVQVPTGPGLGIEIDAAYLAKHKVVPGDLNGTKVDASA